MERRKKRSDKLIAGFLALLTAFSPIASVVPVYASSLDDDGTGSSVTIKAKNRFYTLERV